MHYCNMSSLAPSTRYVYSFGDEEIGMTAQHVLPLSLHYESYWIVGAVLSASTCTDQTPDHGALLCVCACVRACVCVCVCVCCGHDTTQARAFLTSLDAAIDRCALQV